MKQKDSKQKLTKEEKKKIQEETVLREQERAQRLEDEIVLMELKEKKRLEEIYRKMEEKERKRQEKEEKKQKKVQHKAEKKAPSQSLPTELPVFSDADEDTESTLTEEAPVELPDLFPEEAEETETVFQSPVDAPVELPVEETESATEVFEEPEEEVYSSPAEPISEEERVIMSASIRIAQAQLEEKEELAKQSEISRKERLEEERRARLRQKIEEYRQEAEQRDAQLAANNKKGRKKASKPRQTPAYPTAAPVPVEYTEPEQIPYDEPEAVGTQAYPDEPEAKPLLSKKELKKLPRKERKAVKKAQADQLRKQRIIEYYELLEQEQKRKYQKKMGLDYTVADRNAQKRFKGEDKTRDKELALEQKRREKLAKKGLEPDFRNTGFKQPDFYAPAKKENGASDLNSLLTPLSDDDD